MNCTHCQDTKVVRVYDDTTEEETEAGSGIFATPREERPCPMCAVEHRKVTFKLGYLRQIAEMIGEYDDKASVFDQRYNAEAIGAAIDRLNVPISLPVAVADLVEEIRSDAEHEARAATWGL